MSEPLNEAGNEQDQQLPSLFSIEGGLSPLNDYFRFVESDRNDVKLGLRLAAQVLPTGNEYYRAWQRGDEGSMESRYGAVVDAWAHLIDPSYKDSEVNSDSVTAQHRRAFYGMIRTLTAEQVQEGLQRIIDFEK